MSEHPIQLVLSSDHSGMIKDIRTMAGELVYHVELRRKRRECARWMAMNDADLATMFTYAPWLRQQYVKQVTIGVMY
jgi:uncharacterized protein (DUF2342 family)